MKRLLFFSALLICFDAQAQSNWKLYLPPSTDSFFAYHMEWINSYPIPAYAGDAPEPLLSFAGYYSFSHCMVSSSANDTINRIGIVLPGKETMNFTKQCQAYFGTGKDTCFVVYKATTTNITSDPPVLLTVASLISGNGTMPSTSKMHAHIKGSLYMGDSASDFLLNCSNEGMYKPKGWLVLHNDTIYFERPAQMVRKDKPRTVRTMFKTGIVLKKDSIVYAGFDQYLGNNILYVSPKLDYVDRIKILTCFFVIACYTQHM